MAHEKLTFQQFEQLIYYTLHQFKMKEPFDDYVQEAYFIFTRCLKAYNPEQSEFSTYFTHMLKYHLRSLRRKEQQDRQAIQLMMGHLHVRKNDSVWEEKALLLDVLHFLKLTSIEKEVFQHSFDGYPLSEISLKTGRSLSTIKRIRKRLQQKIARLSVYQPG